VKSRAGHDATDQVDAPRRPPRSVAAFAGCRTTQIELQAGLSDQQLEERKAVTEQLLRRNKTRVTQEDQAEAERREQLRQITTTVALYSTLT
jgi:hypothetical protein